MTDHVFKDWVEAPTNGGELTTQEEAIIADYASCKDTLRQAMSRNMADGFVALDRGPYKLPILLIDMGHYVNQDSDLITVARGKFLS